MMRKVQMCFLIMLFLTTVVGCSSVVDDENVDSEVKEYVSLGDRVPEFTVETVAADGTVGTFTTAQLTGETVIVLFNTSCGDCRRELPRLNDYYLQHRYDKGFQMVAISREEGAESVAAYWKEQGLSIPYSAQTDRRIYHLFASSVIPRVYYCSADGIINRIFVETAFLMKD
jgi:thiol-disulfide isomerase/thioredoxin